MNPHLDFLLSVLYDEDPLHSEHLSDLRRSGLTDETIRLHRIRSVPPHMIGQLLGFDISTITSAMLIPFPDPTGGFFDHVRMKIFPPLTDRQGQKLKYLQPRRSGVRLFFPRMTIEAVMHGDAPLWLVEGEKKALAVAQLDLPTIGVCGIEGWHVAGSRELIRDFCHVRLLNRRVELVPDGDVSSNVNVRWGTRRLADALRAAEARPRLVRLPEAS